MGDAAAGRSGGLAGAGGSSGASSGTGGASPSGGGGVAGAGGSGAFGGSSGSAGASDAGDGGGLSKQIGQSCVERIDCASGFCANGVCCTSSCAGSCQSCALPGSGGVCAPLSANTICSVALCNGNMSVHAVRCDGKGACLIPPMPEYPCSPYACDAATGTCHTTCASDADCFGAACVNGSCGLISKVANCSSNDECASGFCADGECCNVACEGSCVSCALPDRVGTCTPIAAGNPDPRGVCRDQGVASCGTTSQCDGFGGCARYAAATLCAVATCVGATLTLPKLCDGLGTCMPSSPSMSCAPHMCRADVAQCAVDNCPGGDSSCVAGAYCSGNEQCTPRKAAGAPCGSDHECSSFKCLSGLDGGPSTCSP
jgi:hypothetical protein